MSEGRRLQVLRAIVQDYVATSEPVGSRSLLERHQLGVSAATVRNDMAALEEDGLIAAPHTSAGRIPTDAGYRLFVDQLSEIKPLSPAERAAIQEFLTAAVDLDDIVDRTVRLLSGLTRQVAVMQYPSLTRSSVRHIELVPIGGSRLMVVLIVTTGRVEQRVVDTGQDVTGGDGERLVFDLRGALNTMAAGRPFTEVAAGLGDLPDQFAPQDRAAVEAVTTALAELVVEEREERVVVAGTSNLARGGDFPLTLGPVLEALEEHVVLLRLLDAMHDDPVRPADTDVVAVRIGHELSHAGLVSTSVVATGYGAGPDHVAGLGVVGPTRMDYPTTMAAVRAVATYVSRSLGA
ncbi:heat-inducible transcriptional repressor HrcA [Arsenicicoccus sp. oral taxon 190]|uniref:heat-inducible transcriptional repressor HrcA n=1 Tax=Arsenicicoccus sp. oral taxon 190 TaxID=1658671 RepID=UPI00067A190D|nr:heat-inducible transcriptional repressor HrcA [Arsenicicoccus sp. oral taxon 190]AKT52165.1 HrcA family transcriptional regulator [Arsenicicoccus sp. oral taxon 190]